MQEFLTSSAREELRLRHRRERDRRVADRIKAILLADKGWSYIRIAEALMLDEETISRHIQEYTEDNKLKPSNGGSSPKLNAKQTSDLTCHLDEHTYTKVSEVVVYVNTTYGVIYTVTGMTSWLKNNGFSYKKPAATPSKANPEKQAAFIQGYEHLLNTTQPDEPIFFGDGVHPTMATKVSYGWIRTGKRKPILTTASRTRVNLFGSLNLETMELHTTSHMTIDHLSMGEHMRKLRLIHPNAPKIHLILDQGPYNKCAETQKHAKDNNIEIHYLPPYSPNLNPIERCWPIMNEHVRNNRFFASAKEFRDAIDHFFRVTWKEIAWSVRDRVNDNFQILSVS